jgi:hypothetical protein
VGRRSEERDAQRADFPRSIGDLGNANGRLIAAFPARTPYRYDDADGSLADRRSALIASALRPTVSHPLSHQIG